MKPRYSLRRTLYRDASRIDDVRMSWSTAQNILIVGQEAVSMGGNDGTGNGVRVGEERAPTRPPQADAPQQLNNNAGPSSTTTLQDPFAKLKEICRKERERGFSLMLEKAGKPDSHVEVPCGRPCCGEPQVDDELG